MKKNLHMGLKELAPTWWYIVKKITCRRMFQNFSEWFQKKPGQETITWKKISVGNWGRGA